MILKSQETVEHRTVANEKKHGNISRKVMRSMISPQYARWFIRTFILDTEE